MDTLIVCIIHWYPHSLFLTNVRPDWIQTKIKWKLHVLFTLHFKFWKYVLITTCSYCLILFYISFYPINCQWCCPHMETKWFAQQTGWLVSVWGATLAQLMGQSVSAILHNFRELHSTLPKKKKKKNHSNRFSQTPYPNNGQGLLIKTRFFADVPLVKNSLKCCKFCSF